MLVKTALDIRLVYDYATLYITHCILFTFFMGVQQKAINVEILLPWQLYCLYAIYHFRLDFLSCYDVI